jgi:membrane fusion protein
MRASSVEAPFLPSAPPRWATAGLWYCLMGLAALGLLALLLVRVPETVSGRFTLVPERGVDPIRSHRDGLVTRVASVEGAHVPAGAPLFVLRSAAVVDRTSELETLEARVAGDSLQLMLAASRDDARRRTDAGEERRLRGRLEFLENRRAAHALRYAVARELADSFASGVRTGAISRLEAARLGLEASSLAGEVETTRSDIAETREDLARHAHDAVAADVEYRQIRQRLQSALEAARARIATLRLDPAATSGAHLTISAPCAGIVLRSHVRTAGAVVREGDVLAEIACDGERLQGELMLSEAGVPLLRRGQAVRLRFDAFPYQRFGVRFGTVRWLGPAGSAGETALRFRALFALRDTAIAVHGSPRPFLTGMSGTAEILVGRRSLMSYVLEPVRALRERYAEPAA